MKNAKYLCLVSLLVLSFSCDDKKCDKEKKLIPFTNLVTDIVNNSCRIQNADSIKNNVSVDLVINSQADYEKYVMCVKSLPTVDFTKSTLLAGKIFWPTCALLYNQIFALDCDGYTLTSTVQDSKDGSLFCGGEVVIPYFLIIDKTNSIKVNYKVVNKN